jgi:serine/threonine protein kinase
VTPSNLLVTAAGLVKLGDFGVAWCAAETPIFAVQAAGTPGFAAPEQHRGAGTVDARTDLFGLAHSLVAIADELPDPLAAALARSCREAPCERHESARALSQQLHEAADTLQTRIEPTALCSWIARHGGLPERQAPPSIDGAVSSILADVPARRATAPGAGQVVSAHRRSRTPAFLALAVGAALAAVFGWAILRPEAGEPVAVDGTAAAATRHEGPRSVETSTPTPPPPPLPLGQAGLEAGGGAKKRSDSRPAPRARGTVQLNAVPWAAVTVDGRHVGNTPIRDLALAAGSHRVVLENGPQELEREVEIHVTGNQSQIFLVDLRRGTVNKRLATRENTGR